jgi:methylated-DNA-protein-cysteine methyltransferase related protein
VEGDAPRGERGRRPGTALPPGGHPEPPDRLTDFQRAVVDIVRGLAAGEVVTYAEVATEAGRPGSAQAVANVLRRVPGLPWWRVVPSTGRLYRTHAPVQVPLLRREGVRIDDDRRIASTTD